MTFLIVSFFFEEVASVRGESHDLCDSSMSALPAPETLHSRGRNLVFIGLHFRLTDLRSRAIPSVITTLTSTYSKLKVTFYNGFLLNLKNYCLAVKRPLTRYGKG